MTRITALIFSIGLVLASCTTDGVSKLDQSLATQVCDTLSPITYDSKLDTPATKVQIKTYDAKRAAFCNNTQETKK